MDGYYNLNANLSRLADVMLQVALSIQDLTAHLKTQAQPLPEPQKAPLVGDDLPLRIGTHSHEVGSCICDRWPTDKRLREFIAERGGAVSVLDCMVSFGIETHAQAIAMIGEAVSRHAIESTTDETGAMWYQLATPDEPPVSGKRPIDAPWIPDELPQSEAQPIAYSPQTADSFLVTPPSPPAIESVEEPDGKMTAGQWGTSKHFLEFMKQDAFKGWSVEEQNAQRDKFVEHVNKTTPGKKMGRWGQQFKIFHNLKEKK